MSQRSSHRHLRAAVSIVVASACLTVPAAAFADQSTQQQDAQATTTTANDNSIFDYDISITYDGNGATGGSTDRTTGHAGDTLRVAANGFTRDGFRFISWNTLPNGMGLTLLPNQILPKSLLPNVTLYAQWAQQPTNDLHGLPQSIDDTNVETFAGTAPDLPDTVTVRYSDNTVKQERVNWDSNRDWTTMRPSRVMLVGTVSTGGFRLVASATVTVKSPFTDVNILTPHDTDIYWLSGRNITIGYPDGSFSPMGDVYRQDMAAFLYRLAGSPSFDVSKAKNPFTDVNASTPHYKEILWLASTGISEGWTVRGHKEFRPMSSVVRQDMAAFLHRLAIYKNVAGAKNYVPTDADKAKFADVDDSTPHAVDIWWLSNTGVADGYTDHTYQGMTPVYRQDMAAFLHRMGTKVL